MQPPYERLHQMLSRGKISCWYARSVWPLGRTRNRLKRRCVAHNPSEATGDFARDARSMNRIPSSRDLIYDMINEFVEATSRVAELLCAEEEERG